MTDSSATVRAKLEQPFRARPEDRQTALVLRGVDGSGRVGWLVTALAPLDGWRIVHVTIPPEAAGTGARSLGPLLDQLEGVVPEAEEVIERLRSRLATRAMETEPSWPDRFAEVLAQAVAAAPPVLVAIDGAHHLDDAALAAIAATCRRADLGAVVVLGVRPQGDPRIKTLALPMLATAPLHVLALVELVQRRADRHLAPAVAAAILRHVQDEPSAAIEVAAQLDADQLAGWTALPLPLPSVAGWACPVESLPEGSRSALLLTALAYRADPSVLARAFELADLPAGSLLAAEASGVVQVDAAAVAFAHPLDRSAIVAGTSPVARHRAHEQLARAFAEVAPQDLQARVHHLIASPTARPDQVLPLLRELAAWEETAGRPLEAARTWVAVARTSPSPAERRARFAWAAALARAAGVAAWGDQLGPPAESDGPRHLPSDADGPYTAHHRLTAAGEQLAERAPDRAARLHATAAVAALLAGAISPAAAAAQRSVELASDGSVEAAWAGTSQCIIDTLTAAGGASRTRIDHHLAAFLPATQDPDGALLRTGGHLSRIWSGDVEGARRDLRALTAELEGAGHTGHLPLTLACLAAADHRRGWWDAATGHANRARELAIRTDQPFLGSLATVGLATIAAGRGQRDRCHRLLTEITEIATQAGAEPLLQYAAAAEGLLELGLGSPDVAVARLEAAEEDAWRLGVRSSTVLGCVGDLLWAYVESDRTREAGELLNRLEDEAQRSDNPWVAALARRGEAVLGPPEAAAEHLEASSRLFGLVIDLFEQARNRLLTAKIALERGDPTTARSDARLARLTFTSLQATPWSARADHILEAADETGGTAKLASLTPQQRRVVELITAGATNLEVATAMVLSPKTVEYHLHHIYRKLDISSRSELVRLALQATYQGRATS